MPHDGDVWTEPVFAGCHRLNGNGELTGLEWIREAGLLGGPIAITNTHSVGVVRDALVAPRRRGGAVRDGGLWSLPVVGETWDGLLNDIDGLHVRPEHVDAALGAARDGAGRRRATSAAGPGWSATSSRAGSGRRRGSWPPRPGGWTVGVLVQANYGERDQLRIDGVPVGAAIPVSDVPSPYDPATMPTRRARRGRGRRAAAEPGAGSIIVIVATDAPLLPHQCERLAQRATLGLARMGSTGEPLVGRPLPRVRDRQPRPPDDRRAGRDGPVTHDVRMVLDNRMTPLFKATVEATEAAIVNALLAADTLTGRDGVTAHALTHDRLVEVMARYGRGPRAGGAG